MLRGGTEFGVSHHLTQPEMFLFQVIYPLKEIYPDSGELSFLHRIFSSLLPLLCLTGLPWA